MQKNFYYLSLFMGGLFCVMGIVIQIFPPPMMQPPSPVFTKHMAGILLIFYGGFRLYRAYKGLERFKQDQ